MNSRTMRIGGAALFSVLMFALAACGGGGGYGGGGGGGGSGPVATITISPATATIAVNGTQQYTAVAKDSNGNTVTGVTYTWASSNTGVATINGNGLATGVAAGTSMITASVTYSGGVYGMGTTITSNSATLTVSANGMAMGTVAIGSSASNSMMNGSMTGGGMTMNGAIGRAVQGATISLKDGVGQIVAAMSDDNGRFQLATSGLRGGFLLKATDNQGHVLYSFADSAGVINITPLTDAMVRIWYRAHGTTADAAFADPAAHPVPQAAQLTVLNKTVVGSLADVFAREGLDPGKFDLIATPFAANGAGFGQVLDNVAVLRTGDAILLRDTLDERETVIAFDATHHAATFSTADLSGRTALSGVSLVLQ